MICGEFAYSYTIINYKGMLYVEAYGFGDAFGDYFEPFQIKGPHSGNH